MKWKWVLPVFVVLIVAIGTMLRLVKFDKFQFLEQDEELWVGNGYYLLTTGTPSSWTVFWDEYKTHHRRWLNGKDYLFAEPFLDHPPLFALLIGVWTQATTPEQFIFANWGVVRLPMIVIAILTLLTTYLLVEKLFGRLQALFTLVAFAFLPSHILVTKVIASEHLLAFLLVLGLFTLSCFLETKKPSLRYLYLGVLAVVSFAAVFSKLSGIAIPASIITLLLLHKKIKPAAVVIGGAGAAVVAYIAYGWYYNLELFWSILSAHSQRPQTFWYFFSLFAKPDVGYLHINDPMMVVGIIGSLVLGVQSWPTTKQSVTARQFILVPWIFLGLILALIAPVEMYAWYKYLFFPMMAMGIGWVWTEFHEGKVGWMLLLVPSLLVLLENVYLTSPHFNPARRWVLLGLFGGGVLCLLVPHFVKSRYYSVATIVFITLTVFLEALWSWGLIYKIN